MSEENDADLNRQPEIDKEGNVKPIKGKQFLKDVGNFISRKYEEHKAKEPERRKEALKKEEYKLKIEEVRAKREKLHSERIKARESSKPQQTPMFGIFGQGIQPTSRRTTRTAVRVKKGKKKKGKIKYVYRDAKQPPQMSMGDIFKVDPWRINK